MANTKIQWADKVWNPVTGCTKVSEGCRNCYAERMAKRLAGRNGYPPEPDQFKVTLHSEKLEEPLHWKKPARIFVDSMGDLFHKDVPNSFLRQVFWIMQMSPIHTYLVLTKRPKRMYEWMTTDLDYQTLPNVWLGVSIENQKAADERIPWLLKTPAAVRFVSVEPMLERINLLGNSYGAIWPWLDAISEGHAINWVICGGESGPKARPMQHEWAEDLLGQCLMTKVPFFFKQWGEWYPIYEGGKSTMVRLGKIKAGRILDGQTWDEYPKQG